MKTFEEFTRKFFIPDDIIPRPESDVSDDSEDNFVIPECWKPKTRFQSMFLAYAMGAIRGVGKNSTHGDYSKELRAAIGDYLDDFGDRHMITKTEILFDGNLNFTVTAGESSATAASDTFSIADDPGLLPYISVDGEMLPSVQSESYTGMTAKLLAVGTLLGSLECEVRLSNVDADAFTDGEHHVLISSTTTGPDLESKTYKELVFTGVPNGTIHPIVANKMLPKTPEELAFALLKGIPVEFSEREPLPDEHESM